MVCLVCLCAVMVPDCGLFLLEWLTFMEGGLYVCVVCVCMCSLTPLSSGSFCGGKLV